MKTNLNMIESINWQLCAAYANGFRTTEASLPVIKMLPLQIGLACRRDEYPHHNFRIDLSKHPCGAFTVAVGSSVGMALGVPVFFRGTNADSSCTNLSRFEYLQITSTESILRNSVVDFKGHQEKLVAISTVGQELLIAQLSGLILSKSSALNLPD